MTNSHSIRQWLLPITLATSLTLHGQDADPAKGKQPPPSELIQKSWSLDHWVDKGERRNLAGKTSITLVLGKGIMDGNSGVNSYHGSYRATDDGTFGLGDWSTTLRGADPDSMVLEKTYMNLLARMTRFSVDKDSLTLSDGTADNQLHFRTQQQVPDKPLKGTKWILVNIEESDGTVTSISALIKGATMDLTITPDNLLRAYGIINGLASKVQLGPGQSFSLAGGDGVTEMGGPPAVMRLERRYFDALQRMTHFEINGSRLTLSDKAKTTSLHFEAK